MGAKIDGKEFAKNIIFAMGTSNIHNVPELALKSKVPERTLYYYLSGRTKRSPNPAYAQAIAMALNTTVETLLASPRIHPDDTPVMPSGSTGFIFPDYESCSSEEGVVDWKFVIEAHNEVMAYIEMGEELGGNASKTRASLPRATMKVYHFLMAHGGRTPTLREMNELMRGI